MALDVGTLVANLKMDRSDFNRGADESERRFSKLGSALGNSARVAGTVIAAGLATAAGGAVALYGTGVQIDALGKKAATVFGPKLGVAQKWAAENAAAMGLTRSQAVGLAAGFGDLLIPMGFTREQATKMSTSVIGLSGALSEWSGGQKSAAEVSDVLAKAMLGERDGLKALGISISDADVKARLAASGQDKLTGAALEQAKAVATQQLIMEKSTDAQAAYAAGADNPIRKQAELKARTLELKQAFATALLPASNAVIAGLLQMSEGALPKVEAKLATVTRSVQGFVAGLMMSPDAAKSVGGAMDGVEGAGARVRVALSQVREAVAGMFPKEGGGVDFAAGLDKVEAGARRVWPQIKEAGASLAGLGPVLTVTGAVFGFFADHIDTVVKYMPLLIAGFIAWKTAQALSLAVQLTQLPVTIALAVSNLAYANAVWALLAAMGVERTSRLAAIVAWGVHLGQIIAHNVALLALRAGILITSSAIGVMTAAQWLLNVALTANPIGLVIAAIALLVGAFVLAWKHSETFRSIVVGALNGVKDVTLTIVGTLVQAWFWWADKILMAAEKALGWTGKLGDKVSEARAGMAAVGGAVQGEIDKLKGKDIQLDVKAKGSWTISEARASSELQRYQTRAEGGPIFGPGTGTSDSIPALLSNGEHVWTAAEVAAMGGHQAMLVMRGAVRRGEIKAYATGGGVGARANVGAIGATVRGQYDPTENALLDRIAAESARQGTAAAMATAAASAPAGGVAGRGNVDAELLRRFDAWNASIGGGLRIVSGYRSSAKQAALYALYLAGRGNLAARPGTSNHEKSPARAIDYGPATWARTATSYRFGLAAPVRSEPWHLERAFDAGGVARGSGMMLKRSIPPERILSGRQTEAFERLVDALDRAGPGSGRGVEVTVNADAGLAQTYAEQVAEQTVTKWRDAMAVHGLVP